MPNLDVRRGRPKRIAVFRALQLGDLLCSVPALRALRHAYPSAVITLIGLPWASQFVRRFSHLVDAFVEFPGYRQLPERKPDADAWPAFLYSAWQANLDVAVQLHGSGEVTNAIVMMLHAATTVGFHPRGGPCPDPEHFTPWPDSGTEVERCLRLIDFLRIARRGSELEFPITAEEYATASALAGAHALARGDFVCVHPGARLKSRRWPDERFAHVARELARIGYRVAVTGTPDEAAVCARVAGGAGSNVVDLCGQTSLGALAGLLSMSRLLVCNDTGVSHVAAALGVPSVVASCGADASRFGPADGARHRVLHRDVSCRPCMHDVCPVDHLCAVALDADDVTDAAFAQLADYADGSARYALRARPPLGADIARR